MSKKPFNALQSFILSFLALPKLFILAEERNSMKTIICIALMFLVFISPIFGVVIEGNVYTIDFELAKTAIVEIDTYPKQQRVITEGYYRFEVPLGSYTINASLIEGNALTAEVSEPIEVTKEGTFVLDLILFPTIDNALDILKETEELDETTILTELEEENEKTPTSTLLIGGISIAILLLILWNIVKWRWMKKEVERRREEKEVEKQVIREDDDLKNYIDYLKKEKRVTQKEMRKHFPDSEAKISLVLTDLEAKGKIKKIKKGRGNIIIWNE